MCHYTIKYVQAPSVDTNTQTLIIHYIVQYSSTEDFLQHVDVLVQNNMTTIPLGSSTCFFRVTAKNSAGYSLFSNTAVALINSEYKGHVCIINTMHLHSHVTCIMILDYTIYQLLLLYSCIRISSIH